MISVVFSLANFDARFCFLNLKQEAWDHVPFKFVWVSMIRPHIQTNYTINILTFQVLLRMFFDFGLTQGFLEVSQCPCVCVCVCVGVPRLFCILRGNKPLDSWSRHAILWNSSGTVLGFVGSCGGSIGFFRSWIWWVQEQDLVSSLLDTDGFCKLQILFGWGCYGFFE